MHRKLIAAEAPGNGGAVDGRSRVDRGARAGLDTVMRPVLALLVLLPLAGCAGVLPFGRAPAPGPAVAVTEAPGPEVLRPAPRPGAAPRAAAPLAPRGRTAAALDTTTEAQRSAAAAAARASTGTRLGETLAGLGSPTEPGLWLETGLVTRTRAGRVVAPSGAALAVELRPTTGAAGAGGRASLGLMRALGLPLAGLTALQVFALD